MALPLKANLFLDESDIKTVLLRGRSKKLHFVKPTRLATMCGVFRYRKDSHGEELDWTVIHPDLWEEYTCCRQCVDRFSFEEFNDA